MNVIVITIIIVIIFLVAIIHIVIIMVILLVSALFVSCKSLNHILLVCCGFTYNLPHTLGWAPNPLIVVY